MRQKTIMIPKGMMEAVGYENNAFAQELARRVIISALVWLTENPVLPLDEEAARIVDETHFSTLTARCIEFARLWQQRMFLAPEPEVPNDVKELLYPDPNGVNFDVNHTILEAYRRGQRSR